MVTCRPRRARAGGWLGADAVPSPTPTPEVFMLGGHVAPRAASQRWPALSRDRPAGLGRLAPRGPDRRCKTRSPDSCCPGPTDRTPGAFFATGVGGAPSTCAKTASKTAEIFSAKSWKYFSKSPSIDREEAQVVVLERQPSRRNAASQRHPPLGGLLVLVLTSRPVSRRSPADVT